MQSPQNHAEVTLALDIGGTFIKSACFRGGRLLRSFPPVPSRSDGTRAEISDAVRSVLAAAGPFDRLAVAIPGPFDFEHGIHKFAAVNGCAFSELAGGVRACFLHDAHAFLLGEMTHGAARGFRRCGAVTLGTGLGTAFAVDGILRSGPDRAPADDVKLWNRPFRDGIAEDCVSARALLTRCPAPSVKALAELAKAGNPAARSAWKAYGDALWELLDGWHRRLAPDVILLGGQIARDTELFGAMPPGLPLRLSALGEHAALYGAAEYSQKGKAL